MKARIIHDLKILLALTVIIIAYTGVIIPVVFADTIELPIKVSMVGSGVALVTGILALLKDFIIDDAINAPNLKIKFLPDDLRDCHPTAFRDQRGVALAKTYYFRIRVINDGWDTAEDVEVFLEEVKKFQNDKFETDRDFMPLPLVWSIWREKHLMIPSGTYRHCDLGFIIEPDAHDFALPAKENGNLLFWFDVVIRPNAGRTSLLPGRYQIIISAFGKNAKKATLTIDMEWKGFWDTRNMISKGFVFN